MPELQSHPTPHPPKILSLLRFVNLNPIEDGVEIKKLPPYQFFPCNFYKR